MTQLRLHAAWMNALVGVICVALTACGDEPAADQFEIPPGADAGGDVAEDDADSAAMDADPVVDAGMDAAGLDAEGDVEMDGSGDADGPDVPVELCGAQDVGLVASGGAGSAQSPLSGTGAVSALSCRGEGGDQAVFSFSLVEPSRVTLTLGSAVPAEFGFEVYRGECDAADALFCFDNAEETFFMDGGVDYFVVVQTADDLTGAPVELSLSTEPIACFPVGSTSCDGDDRVTCGQGFTTTRQTCGLGCEGASCAGDQCENALGLSSAGATVIEGSWEDYESTYDFGGRAECFESGVAVPTRGPDLHVALPGLKAGQTVRVDAANEGAEPADNAIFVLGGCEDTPVCLTGSDDPSERLSWTVPDDGDYIVVIDTVSVSDDAFRYEVAVEDAP